MRTQQRRSISDFPYTPLAAALALALASQAAEAKSIVVDNSSPGSVFDTSTLHGNLRGAIEFLNTTDTNGDPNCTGADTITFFSSNGPFVTSIGTDLPTISCSGLTINGGGTRTSPGAILQSYGSGSVGINAITSPKPVTVKGMQISGWTYGTGVSGHVILDNNSIQNNGNGVDSYYPDNKVTNNSIFSNGNGVFISYGGQVVTGNHIYSNDGDGLILIEMTSGSVSGNVIGLDDNGSWAGNSTGIYAYGNKISLESNVIAANSQGLYIEGDLGSTLSNNSIGINPSSGESLGNSMGMYLEDSTGTTFSNNVLSGTYGGAVEIAYGANITLSNNKIGTDSSGTQFFGNYDGVLVECSDRVSVQNNVIVSSEGFAGITFNGVTGGGSTDIVGNKINVAGDGITSLGSMSYGVILRDSSCGSGPLRAQVKSMGMKGSHVRHGSRTGKRLGKSASGGPTTNLMISGNTIRNVDADSILVDGGFNSKITQNTLMYGGGFGVDIAFGNGIQILDNPVIYGHGGGKNVSLVPGGVYHNTSGALQPGVPNDGQDAPTIDSALRNYTNNTTTVAFTVHGPAGDYEVQVCQNNPISTIPGCSQIVGSRTVHITSGSVSSTVSVVGTTADYFSAISTSVSAKESSEFSDVVFVTPAPMDTIAPTTLNFGNVGVNGSSAPMKVTITSTGGTPYVIDSMNSPGCEGPGLCYGGQFFCQSTCTPGANLNPGKNCTITATFQPTFTGTQSTTIGICDNVYGGTITLTGTGVPASPLKLNPTSFDFGSQTVQTQGPTETFTVTNPTSFSINMGSPATSSSDFVVVNNNCPSSIAAGSSCSVDVAFDPQSVGTVNGVLSVPSGGLPSALQVKRIGHKASAAPETPPAQASLTGTGTPSSVLTLPSLVDLGTYTVGDPANTKTVTLTNSGNTAVTISSVTATGPFSVVNGCTSALPPDGTCNLVVSYSSPALGDHTGTLVVVSDAAGGTATIALTGTTVAVSAPRITVNPAQIGFGDRLLGSQSGSQRITITNIGNAPALLSTGLTTTDFLVSATTCTATLAPSTSCFADVVLRPVGFGPRIGSFVVNSNAQGAPFTVGLAGSGCRPYSAGSSRLGSSFSCAP